MTTTPHQSPTPARKPPADDSVLRSRSIQRVTWAAIITNTCLASAQLIIGLFANAFSLVADAAHTFSDLVSDFMVLFAGRHGADPADSDHPYGHGRIETAATLVLGALLAAVGLGFLWSSGLRLQNMDALPALHPFALLMALLTLAGKELLFRYTLAAARRLQAPLLEANAWHARSDAASSLVVAIGIGGSLAGYPFLEPLAAAVVGFIIVKMGLQLAWKALHELVDTGLDEDELARIRTTIEQTPGVIGLHELRTRRMAARVLCDATVRVAPRLTVSEGHHISELVFQRVREHHPEVQDILVHIEVEDDTELQAVPAGPLPSRPEVLAMVSSLLGQPPAQGVHINIHYLGNRVDVEVRLPAMLPPAQAASMDERRRAWLEQHMHYRSIRFFAPILD